MKRKQIIAALEALGIKFDHQSSNEVLNGMLRKTWLTVRNSTDPEFEAGEGYDFEMTINGTIGTDWYGDNGYSAKQFQDEISPFKGKRGLLNIHSGGGNVWDGFAIAEMVRNHGALDTKVLGLAASAADVIFQSGKQRIMPEMAMRMAHNAQAYFYAEGNATQLAAQKTELDKTINRLEKHNSTLAKMYSDRSGQSVDDVIAMMDDEEFMDGAESKEKGFCDCTTNETPVTNALDLSKFKKLPAAVINKFSAPVQGAAKSTKTQPENPAQTQDNIVNKKQKLALLNAWGVKLPEGITEDSVTDTWLDEKIEAGKPKPISNSNPIPAPAPAAAAPQIINLDNHPAVIAFQVAAKNQRTANLRNQLEACAGEGRIQANSVANWLKLAEVAADVDGVNPIIYQVKTLPEQRPGFTPVSDIVFNADTDPRDLGKGIQAALAPRNAMMRNSLLVTDENLRNDLAKGAKSIAKALNKKIREITAHVSHDDGGFNKPRAEAIASYLDSLPAIMNDAQQGPYGAGNAPGVSISSDMQRQVILSEAMRAFKRRLYPLMAFAHNFGSVPLQGKDEIDVPYYPLFTSQSSRFVSTLGYQFLNTDTENRRQILVGGYGPANKVAGQDRAYQALTYSAYLQRRQPWVDIQRLAVMRSEQLALDILNDIFTAWILKANFGNAVWAGAPAAFDETILAFLRGVAEKSDWPEAMRNVVIGTDYYTNLLSSPYMKAFLNIGTTDVIRQGKVGEIYGFEEVISSPRIPVTADQNLVGFMAYPSAILVATSPILPAPGEMKLMVSYDLATDEDTGLTFEYKYWGEPWNSADREIIECNYGSGLGELNALKRLVAAGQ